MAQQRTQSKTTRPRKNSEPAAACAGAKPLSAETASLLSLVDGLTSLLESSDLVELEVQSGETGILLRKPGALVPPASGTAVATPPGEASGQGTAAPNPSGAVEPAGAATRNVKTVRAPLTGVFYAAPSPGLPPYVSVGQQVSAGQVIGLIEAMKLFNEIKSDTTGRVVRIVAESGKLVKAKQPLIEVEP
jgi:acetyl-CoA carboxylase biotin carboxyl carrier protein